MRLVYLITALCIVVSCGGENKTEEKGMYEQLGEVYEVNLEKWTSSGLADYRFKSSFDWYCNESGDVTYVVEAGQPIGDRGYTVDDIFILIAEKIELKAYRLEVEYDELYGVPLRVFYNDYYSIEDDAWCMVVSDFEPSDTNGE